MSIIIRSLSYIHSDKEKLFQNINATINKGQKVSLVGNNGCGKSTLLQIIARKLSSTEGDVILEEKPYFVPQHFGQYNDLSVTQALGVENKLQALHAILKGDTAPQHFESLNEDWDIEERTHAALSFWKIQHLKLSQTMNTLSGGEKTKVLLSGILIHSPQIILLDEPSNHLDLESRNLLYDFIKKSKSTILVVSHDRKLLNLLDTTFELENGNIEVFGGNYDFYFEQKTNARNALEEDIKSKEKALRKAKAVEKEAMERQQKLDARGKKKQEKAGLPTIMMKTLKNNAEKSTSRTKGIHAEKINTISEEVSQLRKELSDSKKMKINLNNSALHKKKILVSANEINFSYGNRSLWKECLNFIITSGERIVIKGANGSGKTTLIKIILGELLSYTGTITKAETKAIYIDQDYSLINNRLTVYEQAQKYNHSFLQEHDVKIRLNRFLFSKDCWDKSCGLLSGGERMRLLLCCLTISNQAPDIIVLDEPTNNLDIQNIEILTSAINEYKGTLIVVSHDSQFLEEINIEREIIAQ